MANEIRKLPAFQSGTITDDPLTVGSGVFNSLELAGFPVVDSTSHIAIVFDPLGATSGPEVAWITEHTSGSTIASIARGREDIGTGAAQHLLGTPWCAVATPSAWRQVVTSATRPNGDGIPFYRQQIAEYDTGNGLEWYGPALGWQRPWDLPWGKVDLTGTVKLTSSSATNSSGTPSDTGLSWNIPVIKNREYRIHVDAHSLSTVTGDVLGVLLTRLAPLTIVRRIDRVCAAGTFADHFDLWFDYQAPATATEGWKVMIARAVGSGAQSIYATAGDQREAVVTVDDIGPSGLPF